jgi:hypothetical protein
LAGLLLVVKERRKSLKFRAEFSDKETREQTLCREAAGNSTQREHDDAKHTTGVRFVQRF